MNIQAHKTDLDIENSVQHTSHYTQFKVTNTDRKKNSNVTCLKLYIRYRYEQQTNRTAQLTIRSATKLKCMAGVRLST
jgi:hypothetical protein